MYHPNTGNGHAFANIGWTGWIGSITGTVQPPLCVITTLVSHPFDVGISIEKMAISEIGVSFPDDSFGQESRFGIPFTVRLSIMPLT